MYFISFQHPELNVINERFHETLVEHIRLLKNQNKYKHEEIQSQVLSFSIKPLTKIFNKINAIINKVNQRREQYPEQYVKM